MKRSTRAAKGKVLETVDEDDTQEELNQKNGNSDDGLSREQTEPNQPEMLIQEKRKKGCQ